MTPICPRCGIPMSLRVIGERYCHRCTVELARIAPKPEPTFLPEWRKRSLAKDLSPYGGAA